MSFGLLSLTTVCIKVSMSLSTESTGRVSREGAPAAADGGPGSGCSGENLSGGTGPHCARHEAPSRVLVGPLQHESQSAQVPDDNRSASTGHSDIFTLHLL